MRYYIISGEASGDLHGSNLMKAIKKEDISADFRFWCGDLMLGQGGFLVKHYKETAFFGFLNVLKNIGEIKRNFKLCKSDLLEYKPDVLILIDYPGFNLRIAEFAFNNKIRVFYYISPKIWAWKQSRVYKIKKYVEKMFTIFPFETDFYKKFDYPVSYVGNPLLDSISEYQENKPDIESFRKEFSLSVKPIIAVLPGSRKTEIKYMLPVMVELSEHFPDYQFIIAGASSLKQELYQKYISQKTIQLIYNRTYDILKFSVAGVITSGTATLEAALLDLPQLVCYKGDNISYHIAKHLVRVKYISLVNLIENKDIIKEFIQYKMTVPILKTELENLLNNIEYRNTMFKNYEQMRQTLGTQGASAKAAKEIVLSLKSIN